MVNRFDESKIYTKDKFEFLRKNETVINLATIFMKIESGSKYRNIHSCLKSHIDKIDDFQLETEKLLNSFQRSKQILFDNPKTKNLDIYEGIEFSEIKKQFERIMKTIQLFIEEAKNTIQNIERLDKDLLYCFFNYETWGSTYCSELHIPTKERQSNPEKLVLETSIDRILKLELYLGPDQLSHCFWEYDADIWEENSEEYNKYIYNDRDYFMINGRMCLEIFSHFKTIIVKLRDACRTVLSEISRLKKEIEILNDETFKNITKDITKKLESDGDYKKILSQGELKDQYLTLLRLIYDYKKEIEESEWRITSKFGSEKDFKEHLFNYLTRTRQEKLKITKESERVRGKVDIQVDHNITLELKFSKLPVDIETIKTFEPQIRETIENWSNKLGFLVVMDVSKQKESLASRENYFRATINKGGKGIKPSIDAYPVGIISILIFGGERIRPSDLKR